MAPQKRRPDTAMSGPLVSVFCEEHARDSQPKPKRQQLLAQLKASRARIDGVSDALDWYFDLLARIRRAQLRFELLGLDPIEQDFLEDEGREFCLVCRRLKWGLARRQPERKAAP